MAEWKRVDQILKRIAEKEDIQGLVEPRVPKAAKHKKTHTADPDRPTLRPGSKLVKEIRDGNNVVGYALGVVLDYEVRNKWWSYEDVIVQVTKVSNEKLADLVGRLRQWTLYSGWRDRGASFTPEEVNQSDYGL